MSHIEAVGEITAIIYRYSTAMDTRQWQLMDEVFTADAVGDMGGLICNGRTEAVTFIRTAIECCAKTHHMNSNIETVVTGDTARVHSKFSAWHRGKNGTKDSVLLALGTYTDDFVRTSAGWRIKRRAEQPQMEVWIDASRPGNMSEFFGAAFALAASPKS
jgi:ketosteroid isomerase-like protein